MEPRVEERPNDVSPDNWVDQIKSLLSDVIESRDLDDEYLYPDSDSHFRLHEAIRLTTFRGEADGETSAGDTLNATENDGLVSKRNALSPEKAEHYRIGILVVSWTSFFILGGLGTVTFFLSIRENSNASFAFALDAFLVCASSVVLIWRYCSCGGKSKTFSFKRERISCLFLGVLFYMSAIGVIVRCLISLIHAEIPQSSDLMWKLFIVNTLFSAGFAVSEMYLAIGLRSISIAMDAINTALAAILSLSACVNDLIYLYSNVNIWYIDSLIGIICGIIMIVYATWAMAHMVFHPMTDGKT